MLAKASKMVVEEKDNYQDYKTIAINHHARAEELNRVISDLTSQLGKRSSNDEIMENNDHPL